MEFDAGVRGCELPLDLRSGGVAPLLPARDLALEGVLMGQIEGWEESRNAARPQIKWQFTTPDARIKLRSLYPSLQS